MLYVGHESDSYVVRSGVQQGSVLGPLLFMVACVYFLDRTKCTGPRTEGIKLGLPDRTRYLNLMRMFYDLRKFHLI